MINKLLSLFYSKDSFNSSIWRNLNLIYTISYLKYWFQNNAEKAIPFNRKIIPYLIFCCFLSDKRQQRVNSQINSFVLQNVRYLLLRDKKNFLCETAADSSLIFFFFSKPIKEKNFLFGISIHYTSEMPCNFFGPI